MSSARGILLAILVANAAAARISAPPSWETEMSAWNHMERLLSTDSQVTPASASAGNSTPAQFSDDSDALDKHAFDEPEMLSGSNTTAQTSQRLSAWDQAFDSSSASTKVPTESQPASTSTSLSVAPGKLREDYPWYHTGDEIHAELQGMAGNCTGAQFTLTTKTAMNDAAHPGEEVHMDVVRISKDGSVGKKKALFVFGEHARELISPESGLRLIRALCGRGSGDSQELVNRVLATTEFVIVPNANPLGKKEVEAGGYCKRTNEDGVDLNRNFGDDHREDPAALAGDEMNPGPRGFSEPESQLLKDLVTEESPEIFLSVHSGAYLMGAPFGYSRERHADNEGQMLAVLKPISENFCGGDCPYGTLSGLMNYKSKGCDIDWIKETLNTPYVYTWEIYVGNPIRSYYAEEAHSRSEGRKMSESASIFFGGASLLQTSSQSRLRGRTAKPESEQNPDDCFNQFNPETQVEAEEVAENWSRAFMTLADEVAAQR